MVNPSRAQSYSPQKSNTQYRIGYVTYFIIESPKNTLTLEVKQKTHQQYLSPRPAVAFFVDIHRQLITNKA